MNESNSIVKKEGKSLFLLSLQKIVNFLMLITPINGIEMVATDK